LPEFRDKARIGAVNVFTGPDGLVRLYAHQVQFYDGAVPSSPVLLQDEGHSVADDFYLDFGIRTASIPVLSYVDVLNGNYDRASVAGKKVIVGASAVELGDRFAVPLHRVIAGPLLQALAYESIRQDRALHRTTPLAALAVTFLVVMLGARPLATGRWRRGALVLAALVGALYLASLGIQAIAPVSLDIAPPIAGAMLLYAFGVLRELEQHARDAAVHRQSDLRRRAMMRSVLDDSFAGIVITGRDGTIELANPAAGRIFGCAAEEMAGKSIDAYLPGSAKQHERLCAEKSPPGAEEILRIDVEIGRVGGNATTLEQVISYSRLDGDSSSVFIHTFCDISDRKTAEEKLRAAMQDAVAANRTKTEFLANMSHELRTPLNAIIGFSEMIHGEVLGKLSNPRYRDYAGDIVNSGKHLLDIINDILDVSKIEVGQLTPNEEPVSLRDIFTKCVRLMDGRSTIDSLHINLAIAPRMPQIRGDARLIKQMIINLLSNAAKFTPAGGMVMLSAAVEADSRVVVCVADTGIGIAAHEIANVTKPFYQIDSGVARRHEGTGLGLSLVAAYARLHGAELEIASTLAAGTTVTIRFPAARTLFPAPQTSSEQEMSGTLPIAANG
jgi:PAS domain S-box-containing protein